MSADPRLDLVAAIALPATLVDVHGVILEVNDAFLELARGLGLDVRRDDRLGKRIQDLPSDAAERQRLAGILDQVLSTPEPFHGHESFATADGRTHHHEIHASAVKDAACQVTGALFLRQDVTEAVRQKQRARVISGLRDIAWEVASREDVDRLLHALRDGLQELQIPFSNCGVNLVDESHHPATVEFNNISRSGDPIVVSGGVPAGGQMVLRLWREGKVAYRRDLATRDNNGERLITERIFSQPVRCIIDVPFSHGTLAVNSPEPEAFSPGDIAVLKEMAQVLSEGFTRLADFRRLEERNRSLMREVQERRRIQATLQQREAEFRDLYENAPIAYYSVGADGVIKTANARAAQLFGYRQEELVGRHVADLYEDTADGRTRQVFNAFLQGKEIRDTELLACKADGSLFWVSLTLQPVLDEHGNVVSSRSQVVDITERKRLVEQLSHSQKMEAVGQLTAGIAHNFNNLLQGILGNVQLALLDAPSGLRTDLHEIEDIAHRAADLVRQLMLFTRSKETARHSRIDLPAIVHDTVAICRKTFDRRIDIAVDVDADLPAVDGDPVHLQQAVLNLCLNARDALIEAETATPRLEVTAAAIRVGPEDGNLPADTKPGTYVRLRVSDNGIGMDDATRQRVFEPFFTTKGVDQGSGLGLATTYATVAEHDGWIECTSTVGVGTTFCMYLPQAHADAEQPAVSTADHAVCGSETILVVDDEDAVRRTVVRILENYGYSALAAADGEEALEIYRRQSPDIQLTLLDLSMPGLSGRQTLAALRALDPEARVILFTGYTLEAPAAEGVEEVLAKPVHFTDLLQAVRRVLDS